MRLMKFKVKNTDEHLMLIAFSIILRYVRAETNILTFSLNIYLEAKFLSQKRNFETQLQTFRWSKSIKF